MYGKDWLSRCIYSCSKFWWSNKEHCILVIAFHMSCGDTENPAVVIVDSVISRFRIVCVLHIHTFSAKSTYFSMSKVINPNLILDWP
jgi:hypothetical protein